MRRTLQRILRIAGGNRVAPRERRLLFAFTGGAGAWPGMGTTLYRERRAFREAVDAAGAVVEQVLGWSPVPFFRGVEPSETSIEVERRNEIIRLGILQLAQVDLWREEGISPAGVVSVSLGEMVAPYAAGAISREDCARILAVLADAISPTRSNERMFLLDNDAAIAERFCRNAPVALDFLGVMSPRQSVLLGRERDAEALRSYLGSSVVRELRTDWCYHTPRLDFAHAWMRDQLRGVVSRPASCPMYSAAAGGAIANDTPMDAQYFSWMVIRPFRFSDAVSAAFDDGFDAVLNVGPQPSNNAFIAMIADARGHDVVQFDSMRANQERRSWARARSELRSIRARTVPQRSPVTGRTVDFGDPWVRGRLFDVYDEMLRQGPAHFLERHHSWIVLSFAEVQRALGDAQHFSSRMPGLRQADPILLGSDPPEHTLMRRIVSQHFSPEALARRSALAEETAERLLQPLVEGRHLDVVTELANPLLHAIAAEIVGFDGESAATLIEPMLAAAGETRAVYANLQAPIDAIAYRATIHDELLRDAGGVLDEAGAASLIRLLWISALTPRRTLSSAILLLLQHEEVRLRVQADLALLDPFVDEVLRLRPPEHMVPRWTTEDVDAGGIMIPAGSVVELCLASANRDPARFAGPAELRLDRPPNPHVSFGGGVHRCIGAPLARVVMIAALRTLFRLAPDFRAIQPLGTVRYARAAPFRQIEQLVIGS